MGEVCDKIISGKNKERSDDGLYPIFGSTGIIGKTNLKVYDREQLLIARVGANAGFVHIAKGYYDVSDNTLIIQHKKDVSLRYLYYLLTNMNLNQFSKGAGQPLITAGQLKALAIPVPHLEQQKRIVEILDKFEALTHSITQGLPKEIALREQQYEYYREQLIDFPKN
ncbi:Type I restriction enzyme specificity protein MPN_089 [Moraxellaceae bacterium 17A]|nr:Type I restriction enzyme specificity protein MPN_089 [Moraxellaceae bacterium 17A]